MTDYNVAVVRRWVEVATPEDISNAIEIPRPIGTALCMAAALKKDHGTGNVDVLHFFCRTYFGSMMSAEPGISVLNLVPVL